MPAVKRSSPSSERAAENRVSATAGVQRPTLRFASPETLLKCPPQCSWSPTVDSMSEPAVNSACVPPTSVWPGPGSSRCRAVLLRVDAGPRPHHADSDWVLWTGSP